MKILVVEDEIKTGDYLKQGLAEAGFIVDLARDGLDGLHLALTDAYDLAILDVMLPGIDGWAVLQGIRRAGKDMPVLFLTARDQVRDRVHGLELGADDYMVKPFAFAELLARVRIHLRRGSKAKESEYLRIADLELVRENGCARRQEACYWSVTAVFAVHRFQLRPRLDTVMPSERLLEFCFDRFRQREQELEQIGLLASRIETF